MTRSFRESSHQGATMAPSDKQGKKDSHGALRRATQEWLRGEMDILPPPELKEVSDQWLFPKDGKVRVHARWTLKRVRRDRRGKKMFRGTCNGQRDREVDSLRK